VAKKRSGGRKVRVNFKSNRSGRRRTDDWTQRYHAGDHKLDDEKVSESVRAKGDLSRKRTIIVGDDDTPLVDQSEWIPAIVTRVHGLIAYADDDEGREWACTVRRVLRTRLIEQRSSVTVGDEVWFSDASQYHDGDAVGVIENVAERSTSLSRRDRRKREHTIVANADQLLAVFSIRQPNLKPHLVDRYIVAAHRGGLRPILCFNKCDLLNDDLAADTTDTADVHTLTVAQAIGEFQQLGYCCLLTSATAGVGIDALRDELKDHMTVLSGQSGVGKSSLVNMLQPGLELHTQSVSEESEKGRHTTTHAQLHRLDFGGYVVDTPGIRAFDLWDVRREELELFFVEIGDRVAECRFGDCTHQHEVDCAVRAAVESGQISQRRYLSYLKMFDEV
jgi:ribosome biogenesis GTPase